MRKTIHVRLSVGGINNAIRSLERYQQRLEEKTAELVDELVSGGAEMARYAFGSTATVDQISEEGTGIIEAVGEHVIIMEFGAGMATMEDHPLVENAPVDVYRWSYSEQVGSGEGFYTASMNGGQGYWHFGGLLYDRIIPRHGILDARDYIVTNLEAKARSVFND